MPTDTERREVARRLRELCDYLGENELSLDDDWPGILSDYIWPEGSGYHIYDEDCRRIADLIEPGSSATPPRHVTDASATVGASQMEQLLALADEFEAGAKTARARKWNEPANATMAIALADEYEANARRIREAIGAEK